MSGIIFDELTGRVFLSCFLGFVLGSISSLPFLVALLPLPFMIVFLVLRYGSAKRRTSRICALFIFSLATIAGHTLIIREKEAFRKEYSVLKRGHVFVSGKAIPTGKPHYYRIDSPGYRRDLYARDYSGRVKPYHYYRLEFSLKRRDIRPFSCIGKIYEVRQTGTPSPADRWRLYLTALVTEKCGAISGGFFAAILTGQKEYFSTRTGAFHAAGLNHILAMSGLHTGLIAGCFLFFLKPFVVSIRKKSILLIALVLLFLAQSGFSPSVLRAVIMAVYFFSCMVLFRRPDPLQAVGVAGTILFVHYPPVLFDPGFQMTIGITLFLILVVPFLYRMFKKILPRQIAGVCAVTLAAQYVSIPLVIIHFGEITLNGFFSNIFLVPLFTLVLGSAVLLELTLFIPGISVLTAAIYRFASSFYLNALALFNSVFPYGPQKLPHVNERFWWSVLAFEFLCAVMIFLFHRTIPSGEHQEVILSRSKSW